MHQSVREAFHAFSQPLEGRIHSMYVDVKNLVTTGVGNLIDPVSAATQLPWKHEKTGKRATSDEVVAAWRALKNHPGLAVRPGGPLVPLSKQSTAVAARLNDLRLTDEDIDALVERRLEGNVTVLRRTFPAWDSFPADAQLGILSMAWAVGAGFTVKFGNFTRAALAGDWLAALASCKIREDNNPGIVPRNARNRVCFANAAAVKASGSDVTVLHWPTLLAPAPPAPPVPPRLPTPSLMPTLRRGAVGPDVIKMQQALNARGVSPRVAEDGQFGERTYSSLRVFQQSVRQIADGVCGPRTWAALLAGTPPALPAA